MIKFVVMFRQPDDRGDFENAYNDFLALVERMPDIKRRQVVHVLGSPQGDAPYHRLLEIYFDTEEQLKASLMSGAGQEAGNELGRFKEGSFDVQFAEVYEEEGGSTVTETT
ncbi:MAG: EthD family reductase [Anaerolineae bacterium]|nr:EthD family reductase [Anaerolineae bacterium]MDQ7036636.1 EthD family reductase [Anaerolineae bacterium]